MNDRLAFLRAICAHPDDDTPRLVFADWLDEHDDPLGEFIRVQIELEPIRFQADNLRAFELHRREDELLLAHRDRWTGFGGRFTDGADFGPVFRRGFPHSVCWSLNTFATRGGRLFSDCPTIREVTLYGVANRTEDERIYPLLKGLETLEIADWPTRHDALVLPQHLTTIPRLKLWAGGSSWFLDEILRRRTLDWPHEIELVQVYGGLACRNGDRELELDDEAYQVVANANALFGREVVHLTCPFDQRFPLNGQVGPLIRAGYLPNGKPALVAGSFYTWVLAVFDDRGFVEHVDEHESPHRAPRDAKRYAEALRELTAAFDRWVDDKLQLRHGLIRVREFAAHGLGVTLWPPHLAERMSDTEPDAPTERDEDERRGPYWNTWRDRGGDARLWLENRNFVVNWQYRQYRADWRGKIHSS